MISIEANGIFSLGRQGENEYRQITFDITDLLDGMDLTGAEVVCLLERPHSAPIICNNFVYDLTEKTAVLTVTSAETANSGRCRLELDLVIGDVVGKTQIFACNVLPALGEPTTCTGEIPWVSEVLEASEQAQASAQSASASAQEAQEIADELADTIGTAVEEYLEEHPITAPVQSVNAKIGDVVLDATDVHALPDSTAIPTKTSELTNDSGFISSVPVSSVNGKTGAVSLNASDVGALPSSTTIPTKTSQLQNDSGFITSAPVSSVNGQTGDVTITASGLGAYVKPTNGIPKTDLASAVQTSLGKADTALQSAPVTSVDGKTGTVTVIPTGGTTGQVLAKASATDRDVEWITPSGGGLTQAQIDALNGMFRICAYSEDATSAYLAFCSAFGIVIYSITNNLTNATNSNSATEIVSGNSYTATITADSGYEIDTVTVTMGGVDVTASVYADGEINIPAVTGNISITVTTATSWILVKSLSSADLYQGGLGNTNPYSTSRNDRVCYQGFIPAPYSGYVFKAEWDSSGTDTIYYGINSYNATADSAVSGGTAIGNSNTKSHGWFTSGTEFTMEELLNNLPITTIRINWSCGANHSTAVTPAQIDNVKIYCKQA